MTDRKKPGVAFWATVALVAGVALLLVLPGPFGMRLIAYPFVLLCFEPLRGIALLALIAAVLVWYVQLLRSN